MTEVGDKMYRLAEELFPLCRSLTGDGVRETLSILKRLLPELAIREVPTGEPCFDWKVPKEWKIRDAYILDPDGEKIVDFKKNNLHVVGYSIPTDRTLALEELEGYLYSLPDQPDAIPYVTSYYRERWGFCLSENQRKTLQPGTYRAVIDSELIDGALTYGELILPGSSEKEILLSTYLCHPSMANDDISGLCVTTYLAEFLSSLENRKYTYRIVFIPETIGSILYLSKNLEAMKRRTIAGFNITCVGDDRAYSFIPSRLGNTLADRVAVHVLAHRHSDYKAYTFLDRGSDERQYCAPGVDLPVVSVMRSKHSEYPEYHTSMDDMDLISPDGLGGAYQVLRECLELLERNETLKVTVLCEPRLGPRGLYPDLSVKGSVADVKEMMNLIAYCDGDHSLLDIADRIGAPMKRLLSAVEALKGHGLLEKVD